MSKPLGSLDYLLNRPASPQAATETSTADRAIEETAVAWGGPVLAELYRDPQGKRTAFQLVDTLTIRHENLLAVLDVLSSRFRWVEVDRSNPKGDYQITLTAAGREYAEKTIAKK